MSRTVVVGPVLQLKLTQNFVVLINLSEAHRSAPGVVWSSFHFHSIAHFINYRRLIVTDSWIVSTSTYSVRCAKQDDALVTLESTQNHELSPEFLQSVQYLTLSVTSSTSVHNNTSHFTARFV